MKVDLHKHIDCGSYRYWSNYLKLRTESAVLFTGDYDKIDNYIYSGLNATARNRYKYALKQGYYALPLTWDARNAYVDDIYSINTSAEVRQGRKMSESYLTKPDIITNTADTCSSHFSRFFGVFYGGTLVGYINGNFSGQLSAASQILGHADHLRNGIMYLVWVEYVKYCMFHHVQAVVYSRWTDGLDGLRIWKHAVGLKPVILVEA